MLDNFMTVLMMDGFLPDECYADILSAKSKDNWVGCQFKRFSISSIILAIVILAIILISFYIDWSFKYYVLGIGVMVIFYSFTMTYLKVSSEEKAYKRLESEHASLIQKDPKYKDWNEFAQYKRKQQGEETRKRIADAQTAQGQASWVLPLLLGNTALSAFALYKK